MISSKSPHSQRSRFLRDLKRVYDLVEGIQAFSPPVFWWRDFLKQRFHAEWLQKLLTKLRDFLSLIEEVRSIHEIAQSKKIQGYESVYRIKIGDYRLGLVEDSTR